MFIPKSFEEQRVPVLHNLIESQPFGALVSVTANGLFASHIPMILGKGDSPLGTLNGHLSRANEQWRSFLPDVESLAIFSGPQHYISPNWYKEKAASGKVVPTWNYAVVHAYGHLEVIEDPEWLSAHLEALTNVHEAASPLPWRVSDAPSEFIGLLAKGIVGLRLTIHRLEGKWKVSQNRSIADREGAVAGLTKLDTRESLASAKLIVERFS